MRTQAASLSDSLENYLEAIHQICAEREVVRMRDIAERMGVRVPSANAAVVRLVEMGLVKHRRYGCVSLTTEGTRVAERVVRKHRMLKRFLGEVLGVPEEVAEHDACELEHGVSPETVRQLLAFMEFVEACGYRKETWQQWVNSREGTDREETGEDSSGKEKG